MLLNTTQGLMALHVTIVIIIITSSNKYFTLPKGCENITQLAFLNSWEDLSIIVPFTRIVKLRQNYVEQLATQLEFRYFNTEEEHSSFSAIASNTSMFF